MEEVIKLNAVDQYNKMFGLETLHPLVSVVDLSEATGYPRHFHTKEDIAGVWKTELEKQGYQVNVRMQGLGENKAIRQLYMEHIKAMLKD